MSSPPFPHMVTIQAPSFSFSPPQKPTQKTCRSSRHSPLLSHTDQNASSPSPIRFALTGGGSGGHIYPALSIADELRLLRPNANFLFIGTSDGLENNIVPSAGYDFAAVPASRLSRPILSLQNLLFPFHLIHAIFTAWKIHRRFRPDVVIGTGGYVSAPVCLAAALAGTKIVIQEQNAFPGMANKIASRFASKVFVAFDECVRYFPDGKCFVFGNPVRDSLKRCVEKEVGRRSFFPDAAKGQVVLVLGGSQGANPINVAVVNMYYDMLLRHKNRYIIWQTGRDGFSEMESLVKNHRRLLLTPFLQAMDLAYAAADLVVSRAGAMTCTEILTTGKPSILIPSPYVAEDHQTKNAYIMSDLTGSKILTEDELDSSSLATTIDEILGDENLMEDMSKRALKSALPNAAMDIAQSILSSVKTPCQN